MTRLLLLFCLSSFASIVQCQYYGIEKLNPAINSRNYDEISPKVSPDGETIFFTRVGYPIYDKTLVINGADYGESQLYNSRLKSIFQMLGGRSTINPEKSAFNQDIWMAKHGMGTFDKVKHHGYPLNNALPNSVCAISADGQAIYVINQFGYDGGMQPGFSVSRNQGNSRWSFPSPLDISDFYTKSDGLHLAMSEDESIVVMSLMRDDSYGGTDLYVSFKKAPGLYSVPINLGPDVNTEHNEEAPFICSDNKTLYFASDRPGIYGGKDIYKAIRLDVTWESWEEPFALYEPINSSKDDNQPFYHPESSYLYFVSNRELSSDIYRVSYEEELQDKDPEQTVYLDEELREPSSAKIISSKEEPSILFHVEIQNSASGQAMDAYINYTYGGTSAQVRTKNGMVPLKATENDVYLILKEEGFLTKEVKLSKSEIKNAAKGQNQFVFFLDPLVEDGKIQTDPIFFLQSKSSIRKDSYSAIDALVKTLNKHWNISILVQGHTDDQGEEDALLMLSEERAKAVKEYLINKGISPLRIQYEGVGGAQPLNDNSTEALRQKNRRVEIIISKVYEKS